MRIRGMHIGVAAVFAAAVSVTGGSTVTTAAPPVPPPPALTHLDPGGRVTLPQEVPVTIVYVGLEPGGGATGVDATQVESFLPSTGVPINRIYYDPAQATIGLEYSYSYNSVFADQAFEDAFFTHLASIADGPFAPTIYQTAYSDQANAAEDITENWKIDGTAAEAWLATNAGPMLGVDTARPTVFFVNWHGRADFRHHTYTSYYDVAGVDTEPGSLDRWQMSAFGGSTPDDPQFPLPQLARVWFYDLSAGPDRWGAGWELTTTELDAYQRHDGIPSNRFPPIWEYGRPGWYRPFDDLSADLAMVTRFVAINLLFTSSPIFGPALSPPLLVDDIELDLAVVDGDPEVAPLSDVNMDVMEQAFNMVDPSREFTSDVEVVSFDARAREGYSCGRSGVNLSPYTPSCYLPGEFGLSYEDMGFYANSRRSLYLEGQRYQLPMLLYRLPKHWAASAPFGGMAHLSSFGPQGWAVGLLHPDEIGAGIFSPSNLMVHEAGHHVGFSHPHDGYDSELGFDYYAANDTYFTPLGDSVNSVMSYVDSTEQFSQFNRDDMDRWMTATRLQWASRILADIYDSPNAGEATAQLLAADALAGQAIDLLASWDLRGASIAARDAYALVVEAANVADVPIEPWSGTADQGPIGHEAWIQNPVLDDPGLRMRLPEPKQGPDPEPERPEPPGVPDAGPTPIYRGPGG